VSGSGWLKALAPEKRAVLRALHEIRPAWNWVAALFPAMWIATAVVMSIWPNWWIRLPGYVIIGTAIHAMAVLTHEASHYSMFRSRRWDRWVGFLMGAPVFVSHTAYRVLHNYHHKYTREDEDPDEFNNVTRSRFLLSLLFYSWLIIGTPVYLIHVTVTGLVRGSWRDRFDIITEYVLLIGMFGGGFLVARHFGRLDILLHCWALPMIIAMVFGNVRSWAEHTMTLPGDPLTRTRTVRSNRLVSFLMCNLNYHLEHHLCPGIPWYNLPKMHRLLLDEYRRANSFVYNSYLRFLWDAFRNGVHGLSHMPGF
jgi:fatty acid desaturase